MELGRVDSIDINNKATSLSSEATSRQKSQRRVVRPCPTSITMSCHISRGHSLAYHECQQCFRNSGAGNPRLCVNFDIIRENRSEHHRYQALKLAMPCLVQWSLVSAKANLVVFGHYLVLRICFVLIGRVWDTNFHQDDPHQFDAWEMLLEDLF